MSRSKRQQREIDHPIQTWRERIERWGNRGDMNPSLRQARDELERLRKRGCYPAEPDDQDSEPESGAAMDDAGL